MKPFSDSPAREEPPVDVERLREFTSGNPEQLRELVAIYLAQANELIESLDLAIQAGSAKEVENLAHKFCGSSSTCGMTAIVPLLHELELSGRAGQLSDARQLQAQARKQLDHIQCFLADYLRSV